MRNLFTLDKKDYDESSPLYIRPSVRGIVIQKGKIAMVHSLKYDYYKFPGGGIEGEESQIETLIREVEEEAGLIVKADTVREFGRVRRKQNSPDYGSIFLQDNYYYLCDVEEDVQSQILDDYEQEERFTLEFVQPETAIEVNRHRDHGPKDQAMIEREARVLEILIQEGYCQ